MGEGKRRFADRLLLFLRNQKRGSGYRGGLLSLLPPSLLLSSGGAPFVHGVSRDTCKQKNQKWPLEEEGLGFCRDGKGGEEIRVFTHLCRFVEKTKRWLLSLSVMHTRKGTRHFFPYKPQTLTLDEGILVIVCQQHISLGPTQVAPGTGFGLGQFGPGTGFCNLKVNWVWVWGQVWVRGFRAPRLGLSSEC